MIRLSWCIIAVSYILHCTLLVAGHSPQCVDDCIHNHPISARIITASIISKHGLWLISPTVDRVWRTVSSIICYCYWRHDSGFECYNQRQHCRHQRWQARAHFGRWQSAIAKGRYRHVMYKLLYPRIRARTAPPVSVRFRTRVSVSFSLRISLLFCMCGSLR